MVMPRSRSRSISSSIWLRNLRSSIAPAWSNSRSARVDFPWSMWAIMEKLRMRDLSITIVKRESSFVKRYEIRFTRYASRSLNMFEYLIRRPVDRQRGRVDDNRVVGDLQRPHGAGEVFVVAFLQ